MIFVINSIQVRTTQRKTTFFLKDMADQSKRFVVGVPNSNNDDGETQKTTHLKMPPSFQIPLPGRNRYNSFYNYNRSWRQRFLQLGQNKGHSKGENEQSTLKT